MFILALECGLLLVGGVICIPFYAQIPHMHRHLRDAQIPQMHRHPVLDPQGTLGIGWFEGSGTTQLLTYKGGGHSGLVHTSEFE